MPGKEDDANARSDFQQFALDRQRLEQSLKEPSGRQWGGCLIRPTRKDDGELVSAEPGDRVRLPQLGLQPCRHLAQDVVAGMMPEGVVDFLEPIQVHYQ